MTDTNNQWTPKEIIKGKTIFFLPLTLFFTNYIYKLANNLLTNYLNRNNSEFFTRNYSFGLKGIIFIIPAALLSVLIIKIALKLRYKFTTPSEDSYLEKRKLEQEKEFKWYSFYTIPLVLFFVLVGNKISQIIFNILNLNERLGGFGTFISFGIALIYIGLIIFGVKKLNEVMIKKTNTNSELLKDIKEGLYEESLSALSLDDKNEVIEIIKKVRVSSVNAAIIYLKVKEILEKFEKVVIIVGKALITVAKWIGIFIMIIVDWLSSDLSSGSGSSSSYRRATSYSNSSREKANYKKDEQRKAKQLQGEANHAWRHAAKQANHNPNTHHLTKRANRADRMQREADEAERDANNL